MQCTNNRDWLGTAQRLGFSRRLTALANAPALEAGTDSKTQKPPDLARRKAVGCNPLLGRSPSGILHNNHVKGG
jgi:hypothetical protein